MFGSSFRFMAERYCIQKLCDRFYMRSVFLDARFSIPTDPANEIASTKMKPTKVGYCSTSHSLTRMNRGLIWMLFSLLTNFPSIPHKHIPNPGKCPFGNFSS